MSAIATRMGPPGRPIGSLGVIAAGLALFMLGASPAHAVTCEDVRSLSAAEQDYWSKRLKITSAQRHQIWLACYKNWSPPARAAVADH